MPKGIEGLKLREGLELRVCSVAPGLEEELGAQETWREEESS